MQPLYLMLAWISGFLLLTPLFTLGASAARLSARRRDDRLATLRLLGASTRRLTLYTMLDSVIYAAVGFVLGVYRVPGSGAALRDAALPEHPAGPRKYAAAPAHRAWFAGL